MTAHRKLTLVFGILCLGLLIALGKAGMLQLVRGDALNTLSQKQYLRNLRYRAYRGNIYDREGRILSTSVPVDSIFAEPRDIENPELAIQKIHNVAKDIPSQTLNRLDSDRAFMWLLRRTDPNTAAHLKSLSIKGLGFIKEERRFYPNHALLGQTLGSVTIDGHAISGIEKAFDGYLRPKSWDTLAWSDALGKPIIRNLAPDLASLQGSDIYLTIDRDIQQIAEEVLLKTVVKHRARGGWAIVLQPRTGEVLALANVPLANPNYITSSSMEFWRNNAISRTGEPGSTFKIFTYAAALDAGVISPDEKIFCENGIWDAGALTLRDVSKKGFLTPGEIFKYSSNIGTYKIAERIGKERLAHTLRLFGFGERPGLNLLEEAKGSVSDPKTWGQARFANVSFGYGIMASSFQIALAVSAIANGGVRVTPKILKYVKEPGGTLIQPFSKPSLTRAMSEKSAKELVQIMIDDTRGDGSGAKAQIPGILVAGKTGTAEKVDAKTGRYVKSLNLSSFVGFAPADNPEILALVVIDEPKGVAYGGAVAAPAWQAIASEALIKKGMVSCSSENCSAKSN